MLVSKILSPRLTIGSVAIAWALTSSPVQSAPFYPSGSFLSVTDAPVPAPEGFVTFCSVEPQDCVIRASAIPLGSNGRALWTAEVVASLDSVNHAINAAIRPQLDPPGPDRWTADVTYGDCEDYVLTKRRRLIEQGWGSSALVIATAFIADGSYHAVLLARTEGGDFVLDNLLAEPTPWFSTGYTYVKVQSESEPTEWHQAAGDSGLAVGSFRR